MSFDEWERFDDSHGLKQAGFIFSGVSITDCPQRNTVVALFKVHESGAYRGMTVIQ